MAVKNNDTPRFIVRLLGVTALFVAIAGAILWGTFASGDPVIARMGRLMFFVGLVFPILAMLVEIGPITKAVATSRGAVGGNALLQILIAGAILVAVNVFSAGAYLPGIGELPGHYVRLDWTRDHAFTLPPKIAEQMAQLRDDTDIFVVVKHVSFGQRGGEQPDRYDLAAEKKIVEKVKDLANLFQDVGPRFHVRVLDVQDEDFTGKLDKIRDKEKEAAKEAGRPETSPIADTIESAPENSIVFSSRGKVQRLAFHDVYEVDKEKSKNNLVLNFQGVEPFARKIFGIEEKKPRITLAVVHPALSMTSRDHPLLTMNGAKKALEAQGFVCNDILLRKQDQEGGLSQEAAALSFDESRFEQIEEELAGIDEGLRRAEADLPKLREALAFWKSPLSEINKKYAYVSLPNGQQGVIPKETLKQLDDRKVPYKTVPVDEEDRTGKLQIYNREVAAYEQEIDAARKERAALDTEQKSLNVDDLAERKRIADVEAKMKQLLADTDLLILPRFTFHHLPSEQVISNKVHKLDDAQLRALKTLMKAGKPVMFLLGPVNEKREVPPEFGGGGDDRLEPMLAELGIVMPKQTILYSAEMKEFNERKAGLGFSTVELALPPAMVDWPDSAGEVGRYTGSNAPNPVRESLELTRLSVGKTLAKELQVRHPRPVYPLLPGDIGKTNPAVFDESAVFLMTDDDTWNENSPFVNEKREVPRYQATKDGDPKKGTLEEERRGPFPIGVAVERKIPESWYDDKTTPAKTRLAVLGNGGIFVGQSISPIKEKLLLDVSNWLLGRDDLLARSVDTWSFPRVDLTPEQQGLWFLGMQFGLPLLFAYLGVLVWFIRRMR